MISKEDVAALYVALFNRAPEGAGLNSWYEAALLNNWGIGELAESMLLAAQQIVSSNVEYQSIYPQYVNIDPSNPDSVRAIIETVYKTLFNKSYYDDPNGIDTWVSNVVSGIQSIGEAIASIEIVAKQIGLGEIHADDQTVKAAKTFLNRINAALYVSENIQDFDGDFTKFQNYILEVNDDPTSLETLKNQILSSNINDLNQNNDWNNDWNNDNQTPIQEECRVSYDSNPVEEVPFDKLYIFNALYAGYRWDMDTITYSFPQSMPPEYLDSVALDTSFFSSSSVFSSTWEPLDSTEKEYTRDIFNNLSYVINKNFLEVEDGDIRFNKVYFDIGDYAGFAYFPLCYYSYGGDVFLNTRYFNDNTFTENNKIGTIIHELGHALGLKHSFEGYNALFSSEDNTLYTVMSYTYYKPLVVYFDKNNIEISYRNDAAPVTFQLYDILTLQAIYGKNLTETSGNDTYNLSDLFDKHVYMTLWDSGGVDTLDVSDTVYPSYINLKDGSFSSVGYHSLEIQMEEISDYVSSIGYSTGWIYNFFNDTYLQENLYTGENNLAIAYGTIIENVKTGAGDDIVWDNQANNYIYTGEGNDKIFLGSGGNDFVDGGNGYDIIILDGNSSDYNLEQANGYTVLTNGVEEIGFVNVEEIEFIDTSVVV